MGTCGNNKNKNVNESFRNSIVEKFANNDTTTCDTVTTASGFTDYILDFGSNLLSNGGLFALIFLILFVRQNYFNSKSIPSIAIFIVIVSACFSLMQWLYPEMNGFIIAGIGVSVGMAMFKDQFSTIFINNSSV